MTLQRYRGSLHMDLPLTTASSDPVVAVTRILEWVNADEAEAEIAFQAKRGDDLAETINELEAENSDLRDLVKEVLGSGVSYQAQGYREVQVANGWFPAAEELLGGEA